MRKSVGLTVLFLFMFWAVHRAKRLEQNQYFEGSAASSWHKCLCRAEENRSLRDLGIFLSAAHLNNPKLGFLT